MNTCGTCKHWLDRHNPKRDFCDGHWGRCAKAMMRNGQHFPYNSLLLAGGAMSGIKDCDLHTNEAFGCNLWEQCVDLEDWKYCPHCGSELE